MIAKDFRRCTELARTQADLSGFDDTPLYGCGLADFKHVTVTLESAARFIRWQIVQFNGGVDADELASLAIIFRRKVTLA